MSHYAQQVFIESVKAAVPQWFESVKAIEVGSLDINGTVRRFFKNSRIIGVDLGPGPGVDLVMRGEELTDFFKPNAFHVAISTECFEHNPEWERSFINMTNLASNLVVFTCAAPGRPEHGTLRTDSGSSPYTAIESDYYKNLSAEDFLENSNIKKIISYSFDSYMFIENTTDSDLYFVGFRYPETNENLHKISFNYKNLLPDRELTIDWSA